MAFDPTTFNVKDAANADKSMIAYSDGEKSAFGNALLKSDGTLANPATAENQATTNTALGAPADAAVTNPASSASFIALLKGILTFAANILPKGQADAANSAPVVLASDQMLPLPAGAATSANQATANTALAAIQSSVANIPASPATAANQATGNTSLATVATNTGNVDTNLGAKADAAASDDTGTFSLIAFAKRGMQNWTSLLAKIPALVGGRIPVDGSGATQPVSAASLPLPTGAATSANQASAAGKLDTIAANTGAGSVNLTVTPTVTAGAYTSGQVAGGKLSLASAVRIAGGGGLIQSVSVTKKTALTAPYDVYFFRGDPTNSTFTDNAALALNVADLPNLIGVAHCTDLVDNGTPKTLQASNVALPFKLAAGTTLYAVIVARGGETLASTSEIVLNVAIIQD